MGAPFSISVKTPGALTANSAALVIRAAASGPGSRPRIRRIKIVNHANVAASTVVDVYRVTAGNLGTPSVSVLWQAMQGADTGATNFDTAWSSAPPAPTGAILDGSTLNGVIGNGDLLNPFTDYVLEPGTGFLLWVPSSSAQLRINVSGEE